MNCRSCATAVYMTRYGLYDVDRYQHHYCGDQAPPELDIEQYDRCRCGSIFVRINGGEKLVPMTYELHRCQPIKPPARPPTPIRQVSVESPRLTGIAIPRLSDG